MSRGEEEREAEEREAEEGEAEEREGVVSEAVVSEDKSNRRTEQQRQAPRNRRKEGERGRLRNRRTARGEVRHEVGERVRQVQLVDDAEVGEDAFAAAERERVAAHVLVQRAREQEGRTTTKAHTDIEREVARAAARARRLAAAARRPTRVECDGSDEEGPTTMSAAAAVAAAQAAAARVAASLSRAPSSPAPVDVPSPDDARADESRDYSLFGPTGYLAALSHSPPHAASDSDNTSLHWTSMLHTQ